MELLPAYQQSRTFVACIGLLAPIMVLDEILKPDVKNIKLKSQMVKVSQWTKALLAKAEGAGKFSSGARRYIENISEQFGDYLNNGDSDDASKSWRCVVLYHTAIWLEYDIYSTCPIYRHTKEYYLMSKSAEALARMFDKRWPGCDEEGTRFFMDMG